MKVGRWAAQAAREFPCLRTKRMGNAVLLYSNRTEPDIIFRKDFDRMARSGKNLKIIFTLTSPEAVKTEWAGRTGFIDSAMISQEIPDYEERTFYICGPPAWCQV